MPLYEYRCDNCNETFEVIQKFSDEPLKTHEKCGGGPVHRLLSAPALQFKGSGWYITDYAKGSGSSPASNSANGGTGDSGSKPDAGAKTDSSSKSDSSSSPASTPSTTSPSSSDKK